MLYKNKVHRDKTKKKKSELHLIQQLNNSTGGVSTVLVIISEARIFDEK